MMKVDIVVPCYNEADMLRDFYAKTKEITDGIKKEKNYIDFRFLMVNDGSRDETLSIIKDLSKNNKDVDYISFSRNFGKESAMYAGLYHSSGDYVILMDADLQHPPELIVDMIAGVEEGYECVAARRVDRKGESGIRSFFSKSFYFLSNRMTEVKLVRGVVDYRIMSRKMVNAVLSMSETQRFSKGIFEWVGFEKKWLPYENVERAKGETKWNLWSLFKYAVDGITEFSLTPLKVVTLCGFLISTGAFIYIVATLIQTYIYGIAVPGYVTTLSAVLFMGGIIELSVGILGEYLGHVYIETKNRPIFIVGDSNLEEFREDRKYGKDREDRKYGKDREDREDREDRGLQNNSKPTNSKSTNNKLMNNKSTNNKLTNNKLMNNKSRSNSDNIQ